MSGSKRQLEELLFGDDGRPLADVAREQRRLVGRLLLAEILDPPPALRRAGQRSPLGPPPGLHPEES